MKNKLLSICIIIFDCFFNCFLLVKPLFIKFYNKWAFYRNSKEFGSIGIETNFYKPAWIVGKRYIQIGTGTAFGENLYLTAWNHNQSNNCIIQIGDYCSFGAWNHITGINYIKIGNNVLTGKWVTITDNSHGNSDKITLDSPPRLRNVISKGPVIIKDNVWIGDKVTILPNVTIGENSIVAANSVVTKNIPPYCVAAGNPAKIIKNYHEE